MSLNWDDDGTAQILIALHFRNCWQQQRKSGVRDCHSVSQPLPPKAQILNMGRITIFGSSSCSHCTRAKGALMIRDLPFIDIDIDEHPDRRDDMMKLASQFSVPQVFFNSKYIGGAVRRHTGWSLLYQR